MDNWLYFIGVTVLPYIELRGSIPAAILSGKDPVTAFLLLTFVNVLIIYPAFVFLDLVFEVAEKNSIIRRAIERTRRKAEPHIDRWGMLGLAVFVGVPLPGTGAYSGALAAHIFGMRNKRAFLSISAGVVFAGLAVTLISTLFKETLGWLLL